MSTVNQSDGWCPFATRYPTTKFWSGNQGRRAVVMHIAQGSYEGAVSWLSNDVSNPNSSAHFVIAKDGRIAQLVSIWDSAWANGLRWSNGNWYTPADPPRLEHPSWVDMVAGVNPNLYTISVEHEGYYQEQWTPQMYASNNQLLKWIGAQLGTDGVPVTWVAHRNIIGHYEIDGIDRANCPGPNVKYDQMAADANANSNDLFSRIVPQSFTAHVNGTTSLVSLPGYAIVTQLTDVDINVSGYLDYQGVRWYISQYSYQNRLLNFIDSASAQPLVQDMTLGLALNQGYRDAVVPSSDELRNLSPAWIRVFLSSQYQNATTGQNTELDWLLGRVTGLGINVLVVVNTEAVGQTPPPAGSGWGNATSGYIGLATDLMSKIAAYYKDQIGAIEVFNEPDVQGITPESYGALLIAAYQKIKAVSTLTVVSAGICCGENLDYLRRVVAVARGSFDYAGWHTYGERVDGYPSASFGFGDLRSSLASARTLAGKPLWITETGAQLGWAWTPGKSAADSVADYLTHEFSLMRALGRNTVNQAFWFTWRAAGDTWGLVDDSYNPRPAWNAFKQAASTPPPPGPPAITSVALTPATVQAGQVLNVNVVVKNYSSNPLPTQGPDPGFAYNEGDTFLTRGFASQTGAFRVGLDFDGRSGWDHPYRWGLGAPLAPGGTATITGAVTLNTPGTRNYWFGLVSELNSWLQDNQGKASITVVPAGPPIGTTPTITSVTLSPTTLNAGDTLNVTIVVRNDSNQTLATQAPNPGFAYNDSDNFTSLGYPEVQGAYRVGIDFDGRSGIDHPYRWGFGSPLAPGESRVINGTIRANTPGSRRCWAGLVQERIAWLQDRQGVQQITVNPRSNPPPGSGPPTITAVAMRPTRINQGELVYISVTVTNNTNAPLPTQGPDPGFVYNEGDNFFTKRFPPVGGAYRIGIDYDGRTGVDHPYRWGFGGFTAPGQSVTVTGYIRLNRRQATNFWVGLLQESVMLVQDHQETTLITVEQP